MSIISEVSLKATSWCVPIKVIEGVVPSQLSLWFSELMGKSIRTDGEEDQEEAGPPNTFPQWGLSVLVGVLTPMENRHTSMHRPINHNHNEQGCPACTTLIKHPGDPTPVDYCYKGRKWQLSRRVAI